MIQKDKISIFLLLVGTPGELNELVLMVYFPHHKTQNETQRLEENVTLWYTT